MKPFKGACIALLLLWGCENPAKPFEFQETLSSYGVFKGNIADLNPADHVIPYDLTTPLFTDYAHKARFIILPEGSVVQVNQGDMKYPDGTILLKSFFYENDEGNPAEGRRIIETRMLVKFPKEWKAANYVWNEDQTEATRNLLGGTKEVSWTNTEGELKHVDYVIPDNNDCKSCHKNGGQVTPVGPAKVRNMNHDFPYASGTMNQLAYWKELGWISEDFTSRESLPAWDDREHFNLDERARAYLDMNCAHCHSEAGPANNTGLFLDYEQDDPFRLGVYKGPVSAAHGSGNLSYNIVPGKPEESIIAYRMNSTEPGVAMPELGRAMIHEEGVALIQQWIGNMPDSRKE